MVVLKEREKLALNILAKHHACIAMHLNPSQYTRHLFSMGDDPLD